MQYASIAVWYGGYYSGCIIEEGEDGSPGKASLILCAVEHVLRTAAHELGIPMFHEYSWPDGSCYKVIAAEDIYAAVRDLAAAIIEAAPKLTRLGEREIPSFTISGIYGLRMLSPDTVHFGWRGDKRTIEEIFNRAPLQEVDLPPKLLNRKQRRAEAAIERDKRIIRDFKE
jgi:hypothetical protein